MLTPKRTLEDLDGRPDNRLDALLPALLLLACFGMQAPPALAAAGPAGGTTAQRSSIQPRGLGITPNGVTLAASQTQHFKVTDGSGKPVAVHWDVSGLSCSGSACGTVDDEGTYRAPKALSRGLTVVLEGVLVSDPKHSVMTRIQVSPGAAAPITTQVLSPVQQQGQPQTQSPVALPAPVRAKKAVDLPAPRGPLVAYQGGQLTIDAVNTSLADVLTMVAEKTGATIDIPPGTGTEPVFMHAGPGPANDVITQLLTGSSFNFIIVDSPQYRDEPIQVLLTEKQGGNAPAVSTTVAVAPPPQPAAPAAAEVAPGDSDNFVPVTVPTPVATKPASGEQLSPDAIEQMMKDRAKQIRENSQQQQPPQPE
jgi:hypothetical protein